MSFSGLKDVDREILKHVDDEELLKFCSLDRKTWNEVCDDNFLRRRLNNNYPGTNQYKKDDESWKQFFLKVLYYKAKMKEKFEFEFTGGDFKKQYELLKSYKNIPGLLFAGAHQGETSLVKYASKKGVDIRTSSNYPLRLAALKGHLDVVKYLVEEGANIHVQNDYPLRFASVGGHLNVVKYLVEKGANIHAEDDEALRWASRNGHLEVVKYLVEHGADIHAENDAALSMATINNHKEVVKYLSSL